MKTAAPARTRRKSISYAKWGYIFLIPFFLAFAFFTLVPLASTFYNSLFEYYRSGLKQIGPNYVALDNFLTIFTKQHLDKYLLNTVIMWLLGFVPQIVISLLLAVWFTDRNLRIRGQGFFKTVIYMPNLIMASSFSMLIFTLFDNNGPVNIMLESLGLERYLFLSYTPGTRGLTALMNFMMWFGNTTILLMSGVMGIDASLYEASEIDGANGWQTFWLITMPLLRPIMAYTLITSMIGGLQMYDVPQILTKGNGTPNNTSTTLIMLLNRYLGTSFNYGMAGALSVILFVITAILSLIVYASLTREQRETERLKKAARRSIAKGGALA